MSLFTGGGRGVPQRQTDTEMRAARGGLEDLDAAAVRVDELGHDGQADSGAFDVSSLRRLP